MNKNWLATIGIIVSFGLFAVYRIYRGEIIRGGFDLIIFLIILIGGIIRFRKA